jgi:bifunctional non-homologous end joining protein LigD
MWHIWIGSHSLLARPTPDLHLHGRAWQPATPARPVPADLANRANVAVEVTLEQYRRKRDFSRTPEPAGPGVSAERAPSPAGGRFVVQRHRARRLHYDFRLEIDGVLVSWAVPKGPSLDPALKRAAFHVEDHPLDYYDFEGTIPAGEYGGGDVIVWDWGTFEPEATDDPGRSLRDGELKLVLRGDKLHGRFTIVRTKGWDGGGSGGKDQDAWLLIKKRDDWAVSGWDAEAHPQSVKTGRTNDEVKAGVAATPSPGPESIPRADVSEHAAAAPTGAPTGARAEPMPGFIEPMTATLADRPFSDPDWLFEVKWDGYRVQAHIRDGRVALYTRRGLDAAAYFPELAGPPTWIDAREAILDGEVVALNDAGEPDFGLLQARRRVAGKARSVRGAAPPSLDYLVFDLLYLDGVSLLDRPLEARKQLLRSILHDAGAIHYASHVEGDGEAFYDAVAARGLEGVMAKLRRSRYESGRRSPAWLKIKRRAEQEFVVGGWTAREGAADDLAALLVGVVEDGVLRPAGKVGTGFDVRERRRLLDLLGPLARTDSAFRPVPREKGAQWAEPSLVARVEFAEWTADGNLRAPSYKGLELDADPQAVARERPQAVGEARRDAGTGVAPSGVAPSGVAPSGVAAAGSEPAASSAGPDRATADEIEALDALPGKGGLWSVGGRQLKLSNLDKVLWPADGLTKRDLIRYSVSIAPYLLPYLLNRALTLQRYPDGVASKGFWQKQVPGHAPEWVSCWPWPTASKGEATEYLLADNVATLAWAANEAAIDIHPSTFRVAAPDRPTWALIDIDPGQRTDWSEVLLLARLYRTALEHLGLRGFPKLSGQRGIQVWIPIKPRYSFDQTRDWVAALSRTIAGAAPNLVSWQWEKSRRDGLARLDYTQNAWNKTLVAPYSVRPVVGAPVSAPIAWDELEDTELRPDRWTMRTILDRLAARGDIFEPALGLEQELPAF